MTVQKKETTLSQMERERKSMNDDIEHLKQQIHLYNDDFDAERNSRTQLTVDNAKLKQQIKDMEVQFQKIRDDFTTKKTAQDLLEAENEGLKTDIQKCKLDFIAEKQLKDQLVVDNDTLRRQAAERDDRLHQLNTNLIAVSEEKQQQVAHLTQQIYELEQKVSTNVSLVSHSQNTFCSFCVGVG